MAIFTITNITFTLVTLYFGRRIYWETTTGARHRAFIKRHSCIPPVERLNTIFPTWLPTFGLDVILRNMRAFKKHTFLRSWADDMNRMDTHTMFVNIIGQRLFVTNDPENVKSMLATDFDAWSLGQERINSMSEYLGMGIFTSEGPAWKHSREMLRPCFERSAVADVALFEKHVQRLFALLPGDGEEIDLQPLLHELTLDIATEFLFGKSTGSLERGEAREDVKEFIEAFEFCVDPNNDELWRRLLRMNGKRKKAIKTIQGMPAFAHSSLRRMLMKRHRLHRQAHCFRNRFQRS